MDFLKLICFFPLKFSPSASEVLHNRLFIPVSSVQRADVQGRRMCLCQNWGVFMSIGWMCLLYTESCRIYISAHLTPLCEAVLSTDQSETTQLTV